MPIAFSANDRDYSSFGVYWKPDFNILGDRFAVILVNAEHVKQAGTCSKP